MVINVLMKCINEINLNHDSLIIRLDNLKLYFHKFSKLDIHSSSHLLISKILLTKDFILLSDISPKVSFFMLKIQVSKDGEKLLFDSLRLNKYNFGTNI